MTLDELDLLIADIEGKSLRPTRELLLNPMDTIAFARLKGIDDEIKGLRAKRAELIEAQAQAVPVDATPSVEVPNG